MKSFAPVSAASYCSYIVQPVPAPRDQFNHRTSVEDGPKDAAAAFALCAIPSVCANAAGTDACQEARARDKRLGAEVTDPRVLEALTAVVEVSGFRRPGG